MNVAILDSNTENSRQLETLLGNRGDNVVVFDNVCAAHWYLSSGSELNLIIVDWETVRKDGHWDELMCFMNHNLASGCKLIAWSDCVSPIDAVEFVHAMGRNQRREGLNNDTDPPLSYEERPKGES